MRRAIALIELIFAIVIISITLLSVPNMLNSTIKASNNAITQEAVSNGASHLEMIMSQYWDEESTNYNNPILYVTKGDIELEETKDSSGNGMGIRRGSNKETPRRFALDLNGSKLYATTSVNFGLDSNDTEADDIDDFANTNYTLVNRESTTVDTGEYIDTTVNISTLVYYIPDSATYASSTVIFNNPFNTSQVESSNIKAIKVTISSSNDNKYIVFNGFSCNIGSQVLRRRDF